MFDKKLRQILQESRVARLATLNEDATSHVVPIVFANDARRIYFAIDRKPKKTQNLKRLSNIRKNPNVTFLIDNYSEDWNRLSFVLIYASADILSSLKKGDLDCALKLLKHKYSQYRTGGFLPRESEGLTVVRLTPRKIVQWSAKTASKPSLK